MSAEGVNRATLVGNLGQEPELKTTTAGQAVLNMRLATTTSYVDRNNARAERIDWHTVVCWGKRAESLAKILHKGSRLYVEGRIQTRTYEKEGCGRHYVTDIVADELILLDRRERAGGSGQGAERSNGRSSPPPAARDAEGDRDDEIPF